MTIAEKIVRAKADLDSVYEAGVEKGRGEATDGVIVEPLEVAANGTYTAPNGVAYSPVKVNVPDVNGSYDEGYEDGYEDGKAEAAPEDLNDVLTAQEEKLAELSAILDTKVDGYDSGFEDGKKAEYDAFWDDFQKNGTEFIHYGYAFANKDLWTQEAIEKIKYKHFLARYFSVVFNGNTSITDLSAFSHEAVSNDGVFTRNTLSSTFNGCTNLKKCMPINCDSVYAFTNAFNGCSAMEELILSGNIDKSGLDLKWSKKLNKASITSVINCLDITKTGQSVTLSLTAVNNAFETSSGAADGSTSAEWTALVATRPNWTISLADA